MQLYCTEDISHADYIKQVETKRIVFLFPTHNFRIHVTDGCI